MQYYNLLLLKQRCKHFTHWPSYEQKSKIFFHPFRKKIFLYWQILLSSFYLFVCVCVP